LNPAFHFSAPDMTRDVGQFEIGMTNAVSVNTRLKRQEQNPSVKLLL
jgi:hypothetical protein